MTHNCVHKGPALEPLVPQIRDLTQHFCKIPCNIIHHSVAGSSQNTSNVNLLTPNDDYSGRTAPLTSKCYILYIYSTNIGTEYIKHGIYSPFFPVQNAVLS